VRCEERKREERKVSISAHQNLQKIFAPAV
jgi:hypothetical protein